MSEGIIFPGDRVVWNEKVVDVDIDDTMLLALANRSLESGISIEDEILELLKKANREKL